MKKLLRHLLAFTLLASPTVDAIAQGSLTPPGAPAPTMKSLDQIEARTPINTVPFVISAPGSYYLTQNVTLSTTSSFAILVNASNVTIDLNGFSIRSNFVGGTSYAILIEANRNNIEIKNGHITGQTVVTTTGFFPNRTWSVAPLGFFTGVFSQASNAGIRLHNLTISGCQSHGAQLQSSGNNIINCVFHNNGGSGLFARYAQVAHCTSTRNHGNGFEVSFSSIAHCTSYDNRDHGFLATLSSITHCQAMECGSNGINAANGTVAFCVTSNTASPGITGTNVVKTSNREMQ